MIATNEELPEGWARPTLASIVEGAQSGFASGEKAVVDGLQHLRMNNIGEEGALVLDLLRTVPPNLAKDQYKLKLNDVLVCTTNSGKLVGKCALFDQPGAFAFSNHITRLRPKDGVVDANYLRWALWFAWKAGTYEELCQHWVNQSTLPKDLLMAVEIPLPPLAEQKRIVAKVEEVLGRVNAAQERLTKVPAILKRFRQSILSVACSGRLTAEWRDKTSGVESAATLLEKLADERRKKWQSRNGSRNYRSPEPMEDDDLSEIPDQWAWTNFDHCAWEITVGHVGPMKDRYIPNGIAFLRCQNNRPLRFDPTGLVFIDREFDKQLRKSALHGGEILVTRSGANTGDCCVFPSDLGHANCSDLVITRPLSGLLPTYGALYISSSDGQRRIGLRETGMAQPHFNIGAMRVKPFPLPPIAEQHEIVRRVEALFKLADAIEKRVAAATARADRLTQAVLAKAFRGELVPTEAEVAQRERRDFETAQQLLDRIQELRNREAIPPGRNSSRRSVPFVCKAQLRIK